MSPVTEERVAVDVSATIEDRIAALPENQAERLKALEFFLEECNANTKVVTDEITRLTRDAIEKNMYPNEKLLAEIGNRYSLSSAHGVRRADFDSALSAMEKNANALGRLRRLKSMGNEMAIVSVDALEIVLVDTADNVNVEAQGSFLLELPEQDRSNAASHLQERFPNIEQFLRRADGEKGLNYYDFLLVCEITGAEPMPENQYRELQKHKPVDRVTICWILTDKERLDDGAALDGLRLGGGVSVGGGTADRRSDLRAGRPLLRVPLAA